MAEQRYEAVRAVIADGETVTSVAGRFGVARKTVHVWLAKYEAGGLEGLADGSHRPRSCPHQMPAPLEVALTELRLAHPSWGPRRLSFELSLSQNSQAVQDELAASDSERIPEPLHPEDIAENIARPCVGGTART